MEDTILFWIAEVCLLKTEVYECICTHLQK